MSSTDSSDVYLEHLSSLDLSPKLKNSFPPPLPDKISIGKFNTSLYFRDGIRTIDYILAWSIERDEGSDDEYTNNQVENQIRKREIFENNLKKEGLDLEYEMPKGKYVLGFVKIFTNREVCRRYSEILRLRMPMKKVEKFHTMNISNSGKVVELVSSSWKNLVSKIFNTGTNVFPETGHTFTAIYSRDKEYLFDTLSPGFFTSTTRSRIVQFILDRTLFTTEDCKDICNFGIEHLINDGVYSAAYPLHDGALNTRGSLRYTLYHEWASIRKLFRRQPLDSIKEYFGIKIALYFTWLGFYTYMLIPASIIGALCFLYSLLTMYDDAPSNEVCDRSLNITMCPLCDMNCSYWNIGDTCVHARITYLFDNNTIVFFTMFMCFWATMFLEFWKRYSAEITHRWDLTGFDKHEEYPRPQYLARLKNVSGKTVNTITNDVEPKVPFWTVRLPMTIFSFSIVLFLVVIAFSAVVGVVLYRISILAAFYAYGDEVITSYAIILTNITAATINLCCIVTLNIVYSRLAEYLTELELLRTQAEFDDSLTLKMYLFQFVNYYASIFYITFFKGKLVGYPKEYKRIFGHRQEECGPGGCLLELCIQLSIIMVGKQTFNTVIEIAQPILHKWWRTFRIKKEKDVKFVPQWVKDYKLIQWGPQGLFPEYLEMVLQYGFVTIFVAAFPLAPLFALLNNILEMRLDAKKLLTYYRRPIAQRVKSIGIWYRILDSIGKLAVFTNGFIIAFTSDFIPKLVYRFMESDGYSLSGYVEYSLSHMNVSELNLRTKPPNLYNITYCRYTDFRHPPWASKDQYGHSIVFWHVLVARLLFMVIFQNFVTVMIILIRWCIPDVPSKLREQIQRERYITDEIIISHELERAQRLASSNSA